MTIEHLVTRPMPLLRCSALMARDAVDAAYLCAHVRTAAHDYGSLQEDLTLLDALEELQAEANLLRIQEETRAKIQARLSMLGSVA